MAHHVLGYAAAVVTDGQDDLGRRGDETDADPAEPLGVDKTVGDKVIDHLLDQHPVGKQTQLLLAVQLKGDIRPQQGNAVGDLAAELCQIERLHRHREISRGKAAHDRCVVQKPRDAKGVALERAEIGAQLFVAALLRPVL